MRSAETLVVSFADDLTVVDNHATNGRIGFNGSHASNG
jgi:hypothetical protein